jgi:hypothetical protein
MSRTEFTPEQREALDALAEATLQVNEGEGRKLRNRIAGLCDDIREHEFKLKRKTMEREEAEKALEDLRLAEADALSNLSRLFGQAANVSDEDVSEAVRILAEVTAESDPRVDGFLDRNTASPLVTRVRDDLSKPEEAEAIAAKLASLKESEEERNLEAKLALADPVPDSDPVCSGAVSHPKQLAPEEIPLAPVAIGADFVDIPLDAFAAMLKLNDGINLKCSGFPSVIHVEFDPASENPAEAIVRYGREFHEGRRAFFGTGPRGHSFLLSSEEEEIEVLVDEADVSEGVSRMEAEAAGAPGSIDQEVGIDPAVFTKSLPGSEPGIASIDFGAEGGDKSAAIVIDAFGEVSHEQAIAAGLEDKVRDERKA